ncbi:MAG TPA: FHA domain-containing protein [Mycobacteriales bacterium]|nr:FHA domain-containing protein [Mycobacteriales bacterium]
MADLNVATLRYADRSGELIEVQLNPVERRRLLIGRSNSCDVVISWDPAMSREHALLEYRGSHWFVSDDGMSTHGTYIRSSNSRSAQPAQRVRGLHRLEPSDRLVAGQTVLTYKPAIPVTDGASRTRTQQRPPLDLTKMQERVLVALCTPMVDRDEDAPASNQAIAAALFITVDTVKTHLQELYRRFEIQELPPNNKRRQLAKLAISRGLV